MPSSWMTEIVLVPLKMVIPGAKKRISTLVEQVDNTTGQSRRQASGFPTMFWRTEAVTNHAFGCA